MNARYATCYANEASWSDKGQHKFCAYRVWSPATAGFSSTVIKSKLDEAALAERLPDFEQALAAQSNLAIVQAVSGPIVRLENAIKARVKPRPEIKYLTTLPVLATFWVGLFCWRVRIFAGFPRQASTPPIAVAWIASAPPMRKKSENNLKNRHKYLSWAFVGATNVAVRDHALVRRFLLAQKKKPKSWVLSPSRRWPRHCRVRLIRCCVVSRRSIGTRPSYE